MTYIRGISKNNSDAIIWEVGTMDATIAMNNLNVDDNFESFKQEGSWIVYSFFVSDIESAWECALDIEKWYSIRFASVGLVSHLTGPKNPPDIGSSFMLNVPFGNSTFNYAKLIKLDHVKMEMEFDVIYPQAATSGALKMSLKVFQTKRRDGRYLVQLRQNGYPTPFQQGTITFEKSRTIAFAHHFNEYLSYLRRAAAADIPTARPY